MRNCAIDGTVSCMAQTLTFSKVVIKKFDRDPNGGTVQVSASPTKTVAKAMGWEDLPSWQKSGTARGKLTANKVEFIPVHNDLSKHQFELATIAIRDFEFVRLEVKKGKGAQKSKTSRTELHCKIDFNDENGAKKLESYFQSVPESSLKVTYEKEPEQEDLPMATEDQRQAAIEG